MIIFFPFFLDVLAEKYGCSEEKVIADISTILNILLRTETDAENSDKRRTSINLSKIAYYLYPVIDYTICIKKNQRI